MALGVWQNNIRDTLGRFVSGVQVTVLDSGTQANRDLFADRDGVTPLSNPFNTTGDGPARFYSAVGRVDIQIASSARSEELLNVVLIDDFP